MKLIYLASPYTYKGNGDKITKSVIEEQNFEAVCRVASRLMKEGTKLFSPIAHCHPIAMAGGLPTDWRFWQDYCRATLGRCDEIWVLMLDGWKESTGVQAEIELAIKLGLPVTYILP